MSLLLPASIVLGALVLLVCTRFLKNQSEPCALGFADVPIETLVIRKLSGSKWIFHWQNFQGWGYEFEKDTTEHEPSDRVVLKFSNTIVEVYGWNLRRIKEGVVAYTLSLLQEVTDKEVRILREQGEPVVKKIEVTPVSMTGLLAMERGREA